MKTSRLDRLTLSFKCPMNWESMAGNDQRRFCDKCQKNVTDLSTMTRAEAEDFLEQAGPLERTCVRLLRDSQGRLITKGCGKLADERTKFVRKSLSVATAASALSLAACSEKMENDNQHTVGMISPVAEK